MLFEKESLATKETDGRSKGRKVGRAEGRKRKV